MTIEISPTVLISGPTSCVPQNTEFDLTSTISGTAPMTYQWTLLNGTPTQVATNSTYSVASATGDDYGTYQLTATNMCGSGNDQYAILQCTCPPYRVQVSGDQVCQGSSGNLCVTNPPIGVPGVSYSWNGLPASSDLCYTVSDDNSYTVIVNIPNQGLQCPYTGQGSLTINPIPDAPTVSGDSVCNGTTGTLTATENGTDTYTYLWGDGTQSQSLENVSPDIIYSVTVTDQTTTCSNTGSGELYLISTPPDAECKSFITVNLDPVTGQASITTADIDNGSTASCLPITLSLDQYNFDCTNVGNNIVTLTVTDNNGNQATCQTTVQVVDAPPVATCQPYTVYLDDYGNASIDYTDVDNGSYAICGIASEGVSPFTFNCTNLGQNTVTFTVTDVNNVSTTCTTTINVVDTIAPVADVNPLPDITGECSATASAPTATDNCAGTVTGTTSDPTTYNEQGTYTITWTFDDGNGNTSIETQTVIVLDDQAPVADINPLPNVTGECSATATAPTATDNCVGQ